MQWAASSSSRPQSTDFHGQKSAPYLDIGQAQLTQQAELGHRPGSDQIKAVPEALLQSLLLRTGMDDPDAGEGELGADPEPASPPACSNCPAE